jgi:hypothetical protein
MASRRHPALPTLALATVLGTAALAGAAAVEQAAARSAGSTHTVSAASDTIVSPDDWNTMVPETGPPVAS